MNELERLYNELHNLPVPKGFVALAKDLDILVYQYSDDIMGLANSYLAGRKIKSVDIHIDQELDQRLEECLAKLNELRSYKQKCDALAKHLIDNLLRESSS